MTVFYSKCVFIEYKCLLDIGSFLMEIVVLVKHMFNKICEGTEGQQLRCVVYGKGGPKTMKNCMKINI